MASTTTTRGSAGLVEGDDSPQWTFGQKISCLRVFRGTYEECLASAPLRGALGSGEQAGLRVEESTVRPERAGLFVLTIKYEAAGDGNPIQGTQLPDDELSIELEKLEQSLRKLPRYAWDGSSGVSDSLHADIKTLLETDIDSDAWTSAYGRVSGNYLAEELWTKLERGQTHYVLYVPVVRIVEHYWVPPTGLSAGGYIEAPPADIITPPTGEYLREGDQLTFNGSTWQLTKKWIGAPSWDTDVYLEA